MSRYENGQEHGQTAPEHVSDELDTAISSIAGIEDGPTFCSHPSDYIWRYIAKKRTIIPYYFDPAPQSAVENSFEPDFPAPQNLRWEIHELLVVEGVLRAGESNLLTRRCFYIDEGSWAILFGEGYDHDDNPAKCYLLPWQLRYGANRRGRWYAHNATSRKG
jgi:hypothetical protein